MNTSSSTDSTSSGDGEYSDSSDMALKRRMMKAQRGRSQTARHKTHLAEGALAGAGAAALLRAHHEKRVNIQKHRGRQVFGGGALGALGAEAIIRARSREGFEDSEGREDSEGHEDTLAQLAQNYPATMAQRTGEIPQNTNMNFGNNQSMAIMGDGDPEAAATRSYSSRTSPPLAQTNVKRAGGGSYSTYSLFEVSPC